MVEVASAYVTLMPSMKGFQKSLSKELGGVGLDAAADKQGQSIGKRISSSAGSALKKVGKGALIGGIAAIGTAAGAALTMGFQRSVKIENAQATLKGLGYNPKDIEGIMDQALSAVKGTSFGLDEAVTISSGALAAGVKDVEGYLKSVGDVSTITGRNMGEIGAIFNKVMANNRLSGEEMNQLADSGIPVLKLIQEEYGVTADEARKMVSSGQVDADAFLSMMETYEGAALESGNTTQGAFNNMKAALARLGQSVLQEVFPYFKDVFKWITGLLDDLGEKVGPWADSVANAIKNIIDSDFADGVIKFFSEDIPNAWNFLVGMFESATGSSLFQTLKDDILGFGQGVMDFFNNSLKPAFENIAGIVMDAWENKIGPALSDLWDTIQTRIIPTVVGLYEDVFKPAFTFIAETVKMVWEEFLLPVFTRLVDFVVNDIVPRVLWFYNEVWTPVFEGVAKIVTAVWENILLPAFTRLRNIIMNVVVPVILWLWDNVIRPAFNGIAELAMWLWDVALRPFFNWIVDFIVNNLLPWLGSMWDKYDEVFAWIGEKALWLWNDVIVPAWNGIKDAIDVTVAWIKDTAWPWIRDAYENISKKAGTLKDNVVGAWDNIKTGMKNAWDFVKTNVIDKFRDGMQSLQDKVRDVKNGISRIWSQLGAAFAKPINVVIGTVNDFLEKVRGGLNDIPGVDITQKWGVIPKVPIPGYETSSGSQAGRTRGSGAVMLAVGGRVPGWSPNSKADNIPAWLTAGEYVLPVNAVNALRAAVGEDGLEALRHGRLPGTGDGRGGASGMVSAAWERIMGFWDDAKGWVSNLWNRVMPDFGSSWPAQAVTGIMSKIDLGKIAEAVMAKAREFLGGTNAEGSRTAMPWQAIWSIVKSIAPEAIMTSNFRPGARTAGYGNLSYHAQGRAIDIVSRDMMATYRKLVSAMPWSELIFSPAGAGQVRNGRFYYESNPRTRADHWDHIHLAMAKGGLVPDLYDEGGWLKPGVSLVANKTGKPEAVFTDEQLERMGGDTNITLYGIPMDAAGDTADEILYQMRRVRRGKYASRR